MISIRYHSLDVTAEIEPKDEEEMTKTVSVPGISCGHCVATIQREVGELTGVEQVTAAAEAKTVTVIWDPQMTDWNAIDALLREIDFAPAE